MSVFPCCVDVLNVDFLCMLFLKIKILNSYIFKEPEVAKKPVPEVPTALPKKVETPAVKGRISL